METQINQWLNRYGKGFRNQDCEMIDSCMHDLDLSNEHRKLVGKLVDEYIQSH